MGEGSFLREHFDKDARQRVGQTVGYRWLDLLDVAAEIQVKHGLKNGREASRKDGEGPEWERLRSTLYDLRQEGYVSSEYKPFEN